MSNKEAERLIIENIQMLDDSFTMTNHIEENIFNEIHRFIEESVEEFSGEWFGDYAFNYENYSWFAPDKWSAGQDKAFAAYYLAKQLKSNIDDNWWLTSLFTSGKSSFGFWLELERTHFKSKPTKKELKAFTIAKNQEYPEIEKSGFKFYPEDGIWFHSFHLDVSQVSENYVADNLVDAFNPITDALKKLIEVNHIFEAIVEEAKQKFGVQENEPEDDTSK